MAITLKQAREYMDLGVIKSVSFVRSPNPGMWQVLFIGDDERSWDLRTADRNEVRDFKTLDFAVSTVEQLGFRISCLTGEL